MTEPIGMAQFDRELHGLLDAAYFRADTEGYTTALRALYSASQARVAELEAAIERHKVDIGGDESVCHVADADLYAVLKGEK